MKGAAILVLLLLGCSDELKLTQVVVTVDSNLSVPSALDRVRVDIEGLTHLASAEADLTVQALPRSVSIVHDGGPFGPVVVTATGFSGASVVLERTAEFSFAKGQTVGLLLELSSACVGRTCTGLDTCIAGVCRSRQLGSLPPFEGVRGGVFTMTSPPAAGGPAPAPGDAGTP